MTNEIINIILLLANCLLAMGLLHWQHKNHMSTIDKVFKDWAESDIKMFDRHMKLYIDVNDLAFKAGKAKGKEESIIDYKRGKQVGYGNAMIDNIKNPKPVKLLKVTSKK